MINLRNTPELLAPAGNLETALAAYVSGADAVYCGLGKYNAREMADNFSFGDMSKLAGYAKKHNKKYYLTFNTLLKQNELEEAAEQLFNISQLSPDGVIVQDLGIAAMLREYYPSIPVHASTQMGIHNSAGVAAAAGMGIERVILERQVTLDELEQIIARSAVEIEIFVHGALCCSLSGKCLFSSWIGGWSGNRGRCKQPCRRRYYAEGAGGKQAGFYFSTQDLYTLDLIPELMSMGVASLKIEGRLKKPSYVQSVVRAYRMVIDAEEDQQTKVLGQAKQVLAGSFGRRWSHGFASKEDMTTVLQPGNIGVSGLLIGSVQDIRQGRVKLDLQRKLHVGDRLRFQGPGGEESSGFTVRTIEQRGKDVRSALTGEVYLPFDREIPPGSKVYKVSQSIKNNWPDPDSLPEYKVVPQLSLKVKIQRNLISVQVDGGETAVGNENRVDSSADSGAERLKWSAPLELEDAKQHGIATQEVARVFAATGENDFSVSSVEVECEDGLFMPPSLLKKLRREFWNYIGSRIEHTDFERVKSLQLNRIKTELSKRPQMSQSKRREISCAGKRGQKTGTSSIQVDSLYSYSKQTQEVELPHFCPEGVLEMITGKIDEALKDGIRRFRVTDLYQLELLKKHKNLKIVSGFPLPVTNGQTAFELKKMGVNRVQAWVELDREGILDLQQSSPVEVELYCYGRPSILATRAKVDAEGEISDPRGRKFYVRYSKTDHLTYIYPYEVLSLPKLDTFDEFYDYRNSSKNEKTVSSFNYETEFV
ncbi:MAG: DUF3656 domain-containing protein [Spirochaetia bacterium]